MLQYIQPITLDVAGGNVYKYVYAKQGDSGSRYVCATILANGKAIDISDDLTAEFRAVKRDGKSVINPATINNDGTITVELTQQTLAVEGTVDADIIIKNSSGDVLSTASFKILVEKAPVGEQVDSANELLAIKQIIIDMINDNGGGISTTATDLLVTILRSGVYTDDQSANIAALEAALGSGGSGGDSGDSGDSGGSDEPSGTMYTVTNVLTNAITSNSASSVAEGASYSTTISALAGYSISSVTVTMGDVDVTADVYADGVISIPAVTGNVEIVVLAVADSTKPAELITDGLMAFFDMRNRTASKGDNMAGFYQEATIGQGRLYLWYSSGANGTEYGSSADGVYCSGTSFSTYSFGTSFTMIVKDYADANYTAVGALGWVSPSNSGSVFAGKYYTTDGSTAQTASTIPNGKHSGYRTFALCVDEGQCKIFYKGELLLQYDGADYDDFSKWYDQFSGFASRWSAGGSVLNVAAAFYTRALSDTEIVEMDEYLKTLEVTE